MSGAGVIREQDPLGSGCTDERKCDGYWKSVVNRYAKRNAMIEQRRRELTERFGAMERGPSTMLVRAAMSIPCGTESPKIDTRSILSKTGVCPPCEHSACARRTESEALGVAAADEDSPKVCGCGCGSLELNGDACPCGCEQTARTSRANSTEVAMLDGGKSECDCECARNGLACEFCWRVDDVEKFVVAEEEVREEAGETRSCIEADTRLEYAARKLEEEIDRVEKRNEILRQLVAREQTRGCDPSRIEGGSSTSEGCPFHSSTPTRPTVSGLRVAVELLRAKSRRKDGMIAVLAESLGRNANRDRIAVNLTKPMLPGNSSTDFDRRALYDYLHGSEPGTRSADRNETTLSLPTDPIGNPSPDFIPAPKDFKIVRQICDDCLLVSWTLPDDVSMITGYEIFVNGYAWSRVGSAVRTEALLFSLDMSRPLILKLYSFGRGCLISKPIKLTYHPCPCDDDRPFG